MRPDRNCKASCFHVGLVVGGGSGFEKESLREIICWAGFSSTDSTLLVALSG